jgi:transcriptional regulator with XRE-family HTH domain
MPHSDAIILQALGCNITLGHLIMELREKSGLTKENFAKKLKIKSARLSHIEKGEVRVSVRDAARFAKILEQSEEQFVRLCLQDMVDKAELDYNVVLEAKKV